jgi:hypothetical protein
LLAFRFTAKPKDPSFLGMTSEMQYRYKHPDIRKGCEGNVSCLSWRGTSHLWIELKKGADWHTTIDNRFLLDA